jgi:hypothetical protein
MKARTLVETSPQSEGMHIKFWLSKVGGVLILRISRFPFGSSETKWHLGAGPVAKHK